MSKEELLQVSGGGNFAIIGGVVAGILTFLGGFLDGFVRPLKCER